MKYEYPFFDLLIRRFETDDNLSLFQLEEKRKKEKKKKTNV